MKRMALSTVAASLLAAGAIIPTAQAEVEVSAEVGVSSMYLWRGYDLGGGAALWGDLSASMNGFYAGIWTSSGDEEMGTEYDLYLGYATDIGDFGFDIGYATYVYPQDKSDDKKYVSPGKLAEAYLGMSYGPASLTYFKNIARHSDDKEALKDYWYAVADVDVGDFNIAYGQHETKVSHVDLTYSYNENLSFTLSKIVNKGRDKGTADEPKDNVNFLVSLSLPIKF